mgnify:CR=1 FL=1
MLFYIANININIIHIINMENMNVKEMLIDSVKYALKGKKDFIFLGLLLWSISISTYITEEYLIIGIFLFIPLSIFLLIEGGYLATIIEDSIFGSDVHPQFKNIKILIWRGIKEVIIFVVYLFIPLVVLIISLIDTIIFSDDISNFIIFILFILSLFGSLFVVQAAIIHYEYNHSNLRAIFEIRTILKKLKNMGTGKFISSFSFVILFTLILQPTLSDISEHIHPLLSLILAFTILPFLAVFSARFMGLIGRYHFKE